MFHPFLFSDLLHVISLQPLRFAKTTVLLASALLRLGLIRRIRLRLPLQMNQSPSPIGKGDNARFVM